MPRMCRLNRVKDNSIFIIGEAATCHGGDERDAHALVDAASKAGCSAIKFQLIEPAELYAPRIPENGTTVANPARAAREKEKLPLAAWKEIRAHCDDAQIQFSATVFGLSSLELLLALEPDFLKIASTDTNFTSFVRALGSVGLPIFLSTGMSSLSEVQMSVNVLRESSCPSVCILHCVSVYPCPPHLANLPRLECLKTLGFPVGFSDHTLGVGAAAAAVAMGAVAIEKHMKLAEGSPTADSEHSLDEEGLAHFVAEIKATKAALEDRGFELDPQERDVASRARRGAYAAQWLARGHILQSTDISWLRPATDLRPNEEAEIVGRRLLREVNAGDPIYSKDIGT